MAWAGSAHIDQALRAQGPGANTRLAEAVGVSLGAVGRWALGARPNPLLWPKIEKHLGLTAGTLSDTVSSPLDDRLDALRSQLQRIHQTMKKQESAIGDLAGQVAIQESTIRDLAVEIRLIAEALDPVTVLRRSSGRGKPANG